FYSTKNRRWTNSTRLSRMIKDRYPRQDTGVTSKSMLNTAADGGRNTRAQSQRT
ncbi:hypothetical protein NDU88_004012, partial [Pleurodeles waltl]